MHIKAGKRKPGKTVSLCEVLSAREAKNLLIRAAVLSLLENVGMFGNMLLCYAVAVVNSVITWAESCGAQYGGPCGPQFL